MPRLSAVGSWAAGDVIAGATVAATSLPQYIAYAELAGLPGHVGLRSSGPPIIAFAFFTGSPSLCIGVTSITALMAHATLGGAEYIEAHGDERWMDLLGAFSVLVGIVSILMAVAGVAGLAQRIPGPVTSGWKLGFAVTVVASQMSGGVFNGGSAALKRRCKLPSLFAGGPPISGGMAAMYRLGWMLVHPQLWDFGAAALACLTFLIIFRSGRVLPARLRLPGAEVILATLAGAALAAAAGYPGDVVGPPPAAPPGTGAPSGPLAWVRRWPSDMPWAELMARLGGAPQALATAAAFAAVDFLAILSVVPGGPAGELVGQGVGCVVSGMVGSAPVGGSLSRSMVAGMTGASSPLMGLTSGVATLALALPSVGSLLAPTPKAVLAAIVLAAVAPTVLRPKDVLKLRGADAAVGWVTALASCFADPTTGFGVGVLIYALLQVQRAPAGKMRLT